MKSRLYYRMTAADLFEIDAIISNRMFLTPMHDHEQNTDDQNHRDDDLLDFFQKFLIHTLYFPGLLG